MNNVADNPDFDPRRQSKFMYWGGLRIARIAEMLDVAETTLHSWKSRDKWDDALAIERVEGALEARMVLLINKELKEGKDFKEIDLLGRQIERLARVRRYEQPGGHEGDLNPKVANRNSGERKKKVKNEISMEQAEKLREIFMEESFEYQKNWYRAGLTNRIRNILKSRQIGATFYFAREALLDAVETGRNQIFLSASKAQAHVFKHYILQFAAAAEAELTGDPIVLDNGATLYFLGTNSRTAQSYHGNLYFDEYFWVHRFQELRKVASGMAMHKKWRQTYFSTPSSMSHEAYPFWTGDLFNRGRAKADKFDFDVSHGATTQGALFQDGQWRNMITVEDALARGCDLFDLDQLRLEYNQEEYDNLLMCQFIDDAKSIFPMRMMQPCMVDSWDVWADVYKPFATRPVGNREVWVGYDPNGEDENGDNAGLVVVLPAQGKGGKHRIIEKFQIRGLDYEAQAQRIYEICQRYNVGHIGMDTTGIGSAVYQLVRKFFPAVKEYKYSPEVKGQLVNKTYNIIAKGRLEFDAGWSDLASSFMAIRKQMTASGRQVTYVAGRNKQTGHADLAWATMHALDADPLDGDQVATASIMEIC
ncbi:terminase large subunit domain-containing protein [Oceanobacter kriegii]|uniref:terminase large subunit domain-containing protein n=1 Tax=Oceanobacter kriegii TaxID=64972 RepID=UPI000485C241|nr:terminase family protein [Oceanobacter kriegii]